MFRWFKRGPVEHRADYSNAAVDSLLTVAAGGSAEPQTTAAVETAVRALSAPYGLASVMGPDVVTPAFLADLARRLWTSGNALYRIETGDGLDLVPASSFEVAGSAGRWVYQLNTPIPGQSRTTPPDSASGRRDPCQNQPIILGTLARSCTLATR